MIIGSRTSDRRGEDRYFSNVEAEVISLAQNSTEASRGCILNASRTGILFGYRSNLVVGAKVSMTVSMPFTHQVIQILGTVVWEKPEESLAHTYGFHLDHSVIGQDEWQKFVSGLEAVSQKHERRCGALLTDNKPIRNRRSDYEITWKQSPYESFFDALQNVLNVRSVENVVVSPSLSYLIRRIRRLTGESVRILIAEDLPTRIKGETILVTNLDCRRSHEMFTFLDFSEYQLKAPEGIEPIRTLTSVVPKLAVGEKLTIVSLGRLEKKSLVKKLLKFVRLERVEIISDHVIVGEKRPLWIQVFDDNRHVLNEVENPKDIDKILDFSAITIGKGFNYSRKIDNIFTNHSHFFSITDRQNGCLSTFMRLTWLFPNHFLPCMLAEKIGSGEHVILHRPDEISYAELVFPYFTSLSTAKVFKQVLVETGKYFDRENLDVILTTYNKPNENEILFLSRHLGFLKANVALRYGDFGGEWDLIYLLKNRFLKNRSLNEILSFKSNQESM